MMKLSCPTKEAVSVLGLGPMGQALAGAFLKNGHPVTVWNRTPGKAGDLTRQGAVLAESVTDAASASELIMICVLDYNAVRAILSNIAASDLAPYAHGIVEIMPAIMTQLAEEADRGVYPGDRSNIP